MIVWQKSSKEKKRLRFQQEQLCLLKKFRNQLLVHDDGAYKFVINKVDDCLADFERRNRSLLKLVLDVKWLIREIDSLTYDGLLVLTAQEKATWQDIKALNGQYDRFGHGVGLGF